MKNKISLAIAIIAVSMSCTKMDLSPKDQAASGNWFKNAEQFEMCLNALLHQMYWPMERNEWGSDEQIELDLLTDDGTNRASLSRYLQNKADGSFPLFVTMWNISYKGINRCNKILRELPSAKGNMSEEQYNLIEGNARFYRACFYARIIAHFGDPVFVPQEMDFDKTEDMEKAYTLGRSDRWEMSDWVIKEFEQAKEMLPYRYGAGQVVRATRGCASGMEARFALFCASIRKWDTYGQENQAEALRLFQIAADAANEVIESGCYTLHEDFGELFKMKTKNSPEGLFILPRSKTLSAENKYEYLHKGATTAKLPRLSGASTCCTCCPSWDLLCAFYDDKGKPIDESSVYNPNKPFEHRDPRLTYTIVEHGSEHLGVIYDPSFDAAEVWSSREGKYVANNDSRTYKITGTGNQYASYNGLVLKKHVDEDWLSPFEAENDKIILRYADVLEIYAEAKIELGQIDQSVLDAMNQVRARAYKTDYKKSDYPKITETDQARLRTILRSERRMEFAWENRRLYDIWRWRIAETVLNYPNYGLPAKNEKNQRAYMDDGMWFMGSTPDIDENGCPNFSNEKMIAGKTGSFINDYAIQLTVRQFVAPKSYLWAIPTATTDVMKNVKNNEGY